MTQSPEAIAASLIAAIRQISDPVDRYKTAKGMAKQMEQDLKQVQAEVAQELHDGRPWQQVGELLGVTGSRAEQISRRSR